MDSLPRHQCLIYADAPSRVLPKLAAALREHLQRNYRCLYFNSPPMVAGMRSYAAAAGVDVALETAKKSLVLSSDQSHLTGTRFDLDRMMRTLEDALQQALADGYDGLWASGDLTWEMGPERDFSKLLEYEWRLEEFFRAHPEFSGVCQYHADTLPSEALRHGLISHRALFVNETLSLINISYIPPKAFTPSAVNRAQLDSSIRVICQELGAE